MHKVLLSKLETHKLTKRHKEWSGESEKPSVGINSPLRNTGYKDNYTVSSPSDKTLPDTLHWFFARYDLQNRHTSICPALPGKEQKITLKQHLFIFTRRRVNTNNAAGPSGVSGWVLKSCADQLTEVFTTIFNLSLEQAVVTTCLKSDTIVLVPEKAAVNCLNDNRPVAPTPIITK